MSDAAGTRTPDRWRRSRLRGVGLLLRHRGPVRGPSLVVALLVLAVAALVAATPSIFTSMTARELDQTIRRAPPTSHFLISQIAGRFLAAPSKDPTSSGLSPEMDRFAGTFHDQLVAARAQLPQPLRSLVGAPQLSLATDPQPLPNDALHTTPATSSVSMIYRLDPHLDHHATLVAGHWPVSTGTSTTVDAVVSRQTSVKLGWKLGQRLPLFGGRPATAADFGPSVRLVGIFEPNDPKADYWALHPSVAQPNLFDDGNRPAYYTGSAYVGVDGMVGFPYQTLVWYPLNLRHLSGSDAQTVLAQLRGAVATTFQVPATQSGQSLPGTVQSLRVTADVLPALQAALGRVSTAQSVLTVAAVGPLAAAIAVLALAIRALDRRRRPLIGLLATRGAAPGRLRMLLAADGLATGLPPAIVAAAVMWWQFGPNASPAGLTLATLVGIVPAAMLASMPIRATMRRARADTGIRSRSKLRWVAELAVLALAGVSLYLLLTAGLGTGGDLLVAAAPLLLAAAACVIVLRLYPVPLHLLAGLFRRRRAAVGYLGSIRALRDPVVGIAPVLAVLAGVSVAVFSAATLSTLSHGADQAALTDLGAPIRATAGSITPQQYDAIRTLPGVAAAARTELVGAMSVQVGDQPTKPTLDVYLADTDALRQVQQRVPDPIPVPGGLTGGPTDGAVVTTDLAAPGTVLGMGSVRATVMDDTDQLTGLGRSPDFVLLDSSVTGFGPFQPTALLIAPTADADTAALTAKLTSLLGPTSTVTLASHTAAALRSGAIATGMRVALIGALIAAGVAAVAALLLTMVLTTTVRARLLAILRILGLSTRQRRALVLWEQAPAALVALVVGAGLGLGLAALIRTTIDLTPFTSGHAQPALYVDAGLLSALLGGFVALVALATWIGLLTTRAVTAATAIKLDEE